MHSIKELWIFDHRPLCVYLQISIMLIWKSADQIMLHSNLYQICAAHYSVAGHGSMGLSLHLCWTASFAFGFSVIYLPTESLGAVALWSMFFSKWWAKRLTGSQTIWAHFASLLRSCLFRFHWLNKSQGHVPTQWSKGVYVCDRQVATAKLNKGVNVSKRRKASLLLTIIDFPSICKIHLFSPKSLEALTPSWYYSLTKL